MEATTGDAGICRPGEVNQMVFGHTPKRLDLKQSGKMPEPSSRKFSSLISEQIYSSHGRI
jgi:hypothetical protein